jgi:hypothetical protein
LFSNCTLGDSGSSVEFVGSLTHQNWYVVRPARLLADRQPTIQLSGGENRSAARRPLFMRERLIVEFRTTTVT